MRTFLLCLLLVQPVLSAAEKAEIKLLIACEKLQEAKEILDVKTEKEADVQVCFFDTAKTFLDEQKVILRARLEREANDEGKKDVDITVKLRGAKEPPPGFETMTAEADWVGPDVLKDVKPSFEKKEGVEEGPMREVLAGNRTIDKIMSPAQKAFAKACLGKTQPEVPWADLRRYGVIEVWKSKHKLGNLKKKVTVEFWRLKAAGKEPLELLEISLKTEPDDKREVSEIAAEFYQTAIDAGLGEATGASKTQKVIEYYKPGS